MDDKLFARLTIMSLPSRLFVVHFTFQLMLCFSYAEVSASFEERIINEVIGKYSPNVRPVTNPKDPVNVTLDITFNNIIDLVSAINI